MFKCKVCGAEIPDGVAECPNCKVYQEPAAKFGIGDVVKIELKDSGCVYYNYVTDSYYNREINMRMYRLAEAMAMAMAIWREDWLTLVCAEEIDRVNKSGLLRPRKLGGFEYPLESLEVTQ